MTVSEYNDIVESLRFGHELEFSYNGKRYFFERKEKNGYSIYDITDESNGVLMCVIDGKDLDDIGPMLLDKQIIEDKSFNDIYPYIVDYYVE